MLTETIMIINVPAVANLLRKKKNTTKLGIYNEHISRDQTDQFVWGFELRRLTKEDHCGRNNYDKTRCERT